MNIQYIYCLLKSYFILLGFSKDKSCLQNVSLIKLRFFQSINLVQLYELLSVTLIIYFVYLSLLVCISILIYFKVLNSVLLESFTMGLPNWIQDPISTQEQEKPTLFQDIYTLVITINHSYQEYDYKCHCARQAEKEVSKSHFQKQEKASISSLATASQNKANLFLMALSTKTFSLKSSPFSAPKKQPNTLQVVSKSLTVDFIFYFLFSLYLIFIFLSLVFSIFRTTWVRVYQSCCHISHKLIAQTDHRT